MLLYRHKKSASLCHVSQYCEQYKTLIKTFFILKIFPTRNDLSGRKAIHTNYIIVKWFSLFIGYLNLPHHHHHHKIIYGTTSKKDGAVSVFFRKLCHKGLLAPSINKSADLLIQKPKMINYLPPQGAKWSSWSKSTSAAGSFRRSIVLPWDLTSIKSDLWLRLRGRWYSLRSWIYFPGLIDYNLTFPKPLGYDHFLRLLQAKHCNFDAYHEINVSRDHT